MVHGHGPANRDGDWSAGNRHYAFQRAQLELLHGVLRRVATRPVILGDDFNISSRGALCPLVVDGWYDPFAGTDPATFHAELLPAGRPAQRIDYLLVPNGVPVVEAGVLFAEPVGRGMSLSDHVGLRGRVMVAP